MSKAQLVITAVVLEGRSKSEVARDYDLSRQWVHQLVTRYQADGAAAFEPHSRPAYQRPRDQRRAGRTHCAAAQNLGQSRLRRRRGHHRRAPRPRPQRHESPCPIHDLAHPGPTRLHRRGSPNALASATHRRRA
jgi:Winged helix-turn helix